MPKENRLEPNPAYKNARFECVLMDEKGIRIVRDTEKLELMGWPSRYEMKGGKLVAVPRHILK